MLAAQVSIRGGTEYMTQQSDRLVGHGDAALGEKVFLIPEAEGESMIEPRSVTDDLGREAVTLILGFHQSSAPHKRQLNNTITRKSWEFALQFALDRIARLRMAKKLGRQVGTDSYFLARIDLWLGPQPRLGRVDRLKLVAFPRCSTIPSSPRSKFLG